VRQTGRHVSVFTPFGHAIGAFIKTYFIKRGFIGGIEGYVNARILSQTVFWKYMLVYVERRAGQRRQG
jgi:(heptosyl)LPS beta-1,4-glucosyltransferase